MLNVTKQAMVFLSPLTLRLKAQRIITAGMNSHHLAQAPHRKFALYFLNEGVPYPDVLAKFTAAFFKAGRKKIKDGEYQRK